MCKLSEARRAERSTGSEARRAERTLALVVEEELYPARNRRFRAYVARASGGDRADSFSLSFAAFSFSFAVPPAGQPAGPSDHPGKAGITGRKPFGFALHGFFFQKKYPLLGYF